MNKKKSKRKTSKKPKLKVHKRKKAWKKAQEFSITQYILNYHKCNHQEEQQPQQEN